MVVHINTFSQHELFILDLIMKKLVTILGFALCTLMMLEYYAQAGDCRQYGERGIVYVLLEGSTPDKKANYYNIGVSGSDKLLKACMRNM